MSQFLFLLALTAGGMLGTFFRGPFVPFCVYVLFAVLRPQFLWKWQLSSMPDMNWSLYISLAVLGSYLPWVGGMFGSPRDPERYVHPPFTWSHKVLCLFSLWMTLSYLFANNMFAAYPVYEDFLKIFIMYMIGTQIVRMVWQVKVLYLVMALSVAYIAMDIVHLYLTTGYLVLVKKGFAGLDNNGAALMLAMGIPLCYFAFEFTKRWYRFAFLVPIPFVVEAIMSSFSRGAMLSAIVGGLFYVLFSRRRVFLICCIVATAAVVPVVAGKEIQARFLSTQQGAEDDSINSRYVSWDCARRIANDYPIFGAGIRCSNALMFSYGADMEGRTVHNIYLQLAADTGWIGMTLYVGLAGFTLLALLRARWRLRHRTDDEANLTVALIGGVFCSLVTFFFGAIFLSLEALELPYFLMLLGGQLWAISNAQVSLPPAPRRYAPLLTVPRHATAARRPLPAAAPPEVPPARPELGRLPTRADFPPAGS